MKQFDKDKTFLYELCKHHVSGQLKVAPEHVSDKVLALMRKSTHAVYEKFSAEYAKANKELGLKQYLVPYYIAGHPGAGIPEAIETALYLAALAMGSCVPQAIWRSGGAAAIISCIGVPPCETTMSVVQYCCTL